MLATIDQQAAVAVHSGAPGGWNDPDMLQVGNGTLTADESRAHFGVWAVLAPFAWVRIRTRGEGGAAKE